MTAQSHSLEQEKVEIALFPIPEMVSFPGTTVPLHVFEPRYRALIRDCVRDERLVAVCHTRKQISDSKPNQSIEEMLKTNQASFEPFPVFSAGLCEIMETTEDGRLRVDVNMQARYRQVENQQMVPYRIVLCETLPDHPLEQEELGNSQTLMLSINKILGSIMDSQKPELNSADFLEPWLELSPSEYSDRIFSIFRFEAELMQDILETRNPYHRLQMIQALFIPEQQ